MFFQQGCTEMWFCDMLRLREKGGGSKKMMTNSNKLFRWRDPYDTAGTEGLFAAAMGGERRISGGGLPGLRPHPPPVRPGPRAFGRPAGPRRPAAPAHGVLQAPHPPLPAGEEAPRPGHLLRHRRGDEPGGPGRRDPGPGVVYVGAGGPLPPPPLSDALSLLHFGATSPGGATTPPSARPALPSPSLPRPSAGPTL